MSTAIVTDYCCVDFRLLLCYIIVNSEFDSCLIITVKIDHVGTLRHVHYCNGVYISNEVY